MSKEELSIIWKLRRVLSGLDGQQALELLLERLKKSQTNLEFLMQVQKTTPDRRRGRVTSRPFNWVRYARAHRWVWICSSGTYEHFEGKHMARIVIADDDADIRELVVFKLRHGGHDVVPVGDGAAAVEACTAEKPDLVILDVMMPGMSGLDAARALRADSNMDGLPIIMLTARAQESDIEQGFEAGADDYIVKPFSPRELASRVSAVLARSR